MFGTPRPSRGRSSTSRDVRNAPAEPWAFLYLAWRSEGPAEAWRFSILLVWQRTYFVVGALVSSVGVAVSFFIVSDFLFFFLVDLAGGLYALGLDLGLPLVLGAPPVLDASDPPPAPTPTPLSPPLVEPALAAPPVPALPAAPPPAAPAAAPAPAPPPAWARATVTGASTRTATSRNDKSVIIFF